MGRLTDWSFAHPDSVLMICAAVGAFVLGLANVGPFIAFAAAFVAAAFTLAIDRLARLDAAEAPHQ